MKYKYYNIVTILVLCTICSSRTVNAEAGYSTGGYHGHIVSSGKYGAPPPQYGPPPVDRCSIVDPIKTVSGTITLPGRNGGRPFHPCIYNFQNLEGRFFKANDTYFPCINPVVLNTQIIGEPISSELDIIKGTRKSLAFRIPAILPSTTTGESAAGVPLEIDGGLIAEGLIITKNTSVPIDWRRNENFYRAVQRKIALRRVDVSAYSETQVTLLKTVYRSVSRIVDELEQRQAQLNANGASKLEFNPMLAKDSQAFATPTLREVELDENEDVVAAERAFGIRGTRIEFAPAHKTADKIARILNKRERLASPSISFGATPQAASRNILSLFDAFNQISRTTLHNFLDVLATETNNINAATQFNFSYVPPLKSAYCDRPIEIDPRGKRGAGNHGTITGNGVAMPVISRNN